MAFEEEIDEFQNPTEDDLKNPTEDDLKNPPEEKGKTPSGDEGAAKGMEEKDLHGSSKEGVKWGLQVLRKPKNLQSNSLLLKVVQSSTDAMPPNLDDFDRVPVQDFGVNLLHKMGFVEKKTDSVPFLPAARPRLLGLGAKVYEKPKPAQVTKGSLVKILKKGKYCGQKGVVQAVVDRKDGKALRVKLYDEEIRCWGDEVALI